MSYFISAMTIENFRNASFNREMIADTNETTPFNREMIAGASEITPFNREMITDAYEITTIKGEMGTGIKKMIIYPRFDVKNHPDNHNSRCLLNPAKKAQTG